MERFRRVGVETRPKSTLGGEGERRPRISPFIASWKTGALVSASSTMMAWYTSPSRSPARKTTSTDVDSDGLMVRELNSPHVQEQLGVTYLMVQVAALPFLIV